MISWSQIGYGAALSAIAAAIVLAVATRGHELTVIATGALAAAAGPIAWNAILRATDARRFFVNARLIVFPISWQDTGSGVFALAAAALLLGFGTLRNEPAHRALTYAVLTGLAALVVDIYLY
jgi:hypothetical protein